MAIDWGTIGSKFWAALKKVFAASVDEGQEVLEEAAKAAAHAALDPFVEEGLPAEAEEYLKDKLGDGVIAEEAIEYLDNLLKERANYGLQKLLTWAETINPDD